MFHSLHCTTGSLPAHLLWDARGHHQKELWLAGLLMYQLVLSCSGIGGGGLLLGTLKGTLGASLIFPRHIRLSSLCKVKLTWQLTNSIYMTREGSLCKNRKSYHVWSYLHVPGTVFSSFSVLLHLICRRLL